MKGEVEPKSRRATVAKPVLASKSRKGQSHAFAILLLAIREIMAANGAEVGAADSDKGLKGR